MKNVIKDYEDELEEEYLLDITECEDNKYYYIPYSNRKKRILATELCDGVIIGHYHKDYKKALEWYKNHPLSHPIWSKFF